MYVRTSIEKSGHSVDIEYARNTGAVKTEWKDWICDSCGGKNFARYLSLPSTYRDIISQAKRALYICNFASI